MLCNNNVAIQYVNLMKIYRNKVKIKIYFFSQHSNDLKFFFLHSHPQLSIGIENGTIETYNADFELQFTHHLKYIVGMCKVTARRACTNGRTKYADFTIVSSGKMGKSSVNGTSSSGTNGLDDDRLTMNIIGPEHGIIYLLKDPRDPLLHIYLYESDSLDDVSVTQL